MYNDMFLMTLRLWRVFKDTTKRLQSKRMQRSNNLTLKTIATTSVHTDLVPLQLVLNGWRKFVSVSSFFDLQKVKYSKVMHIPFWGFTYLTLIEMQLQ